MNELSQEHRALVDAPCAAARPFDDTTWRRLGPKLAVRALQRLVDKIYAIHEAGFELGGVRRTDLALDAQRGRLYLTEIPRIEAAARLEPESIWRDGRLIGELAYENFMDEDYPGGHQMAALLQERSAMAETGLLQPGLTQVVAACVSPYGELALRKMADLRHALDQLALELSTPRTFDVGASSTVGNYIFRRNNQDSCGHLVMSSIAGSAKKSVGFFCVADGIGGIDDGERASKLAVETACLTFGRAWSHYGADRLEQSPGAFARAIAKVTSQRLALEGEFDASQNRGGTTFTGLVIAGGRAGVGHVGDSRAVLVRGDRLIQLTRDHTLASILERLGEPVGDDAQAETNHRTISRFLSTGIELEADRIDGLSEAAAQLLAADAEPDTRGIRVESGDLFVLTSDGVHDEISAEHLQRMAALHRGNPQALSNALVQHSLSRVGRDNATAQVVLVG
ncbi:MAG: PP2C family protein-serine/threonine phosphatase [Persicimonas sp.]